MKMVLALAQAPSDGGHCIRWPHARTARRSSTYRPQLV